MSVCYWWSWCSWYWDQKGSWVSGSPPIVSGTSTSFPDVSVEREFSLHSFTGCMMTLCPWITLGTRRKGEEQVEMIGSCWKNWRKEENRPGRLHSSISGCWTVGPGLTFGPSSKEFTGSLLLCPGYRDLGSWNHISVRKTDVDIIRRKSQEIYVWN